MDEIKPKPCPFCGGRAKVSAREHIFGGFNGMGASRRKYKVRVICNRCMARGPSNLSEWARDKKDDVLRVAERQAIDGWNGRVKPE